MQLPPEAGAPPHWLAYISSPDVDATASQAESLGAKDARRAERRADGRPFCGDVRSAGRDVRDLHAAEAGARPRGPARQGEFSWHELATREQPAAFRFYETLFGWNKTNAMDMGPHRAVSDVRPERRRARRDVQQAGGDARSAGLDALHDGRRHQARAEAAKAGGGQVINGPMEVPGGDWIFQALDPAGRDVRGAREGEAEEVD